jgi:hypothetical protein
MKDPFSRMSNESENCHVVFFLLLTFFPPATVAAVLVYIALRGLHSLEFGRDTVDIDSARRRLSGFLRRGCTWVAMSVGMMLGTAQVVLIAGALITGKPIF